VAVPGAQNLKIGNKSPLLGRTKLQRVDEKPPRGSVVGQEDRVDDADGGRAADEEAVGFEGKCGGRPATKPQRDVVRENQGCRRCGL
jgi:hypothetical protein